MIWNRTARRPQLASLLAIALFAACSSGREAPADAEAPSRAAQTSSPALGLWLARVRATHAAADAAQSRAAQQRALDSLRALASEPPPQAMSVADSGRLRHDLYARGARIAFELGRFDEATRLANEGLGIESRDPFRIQLLIVLAEARRALHDRVGEADALASARTELRRNTR